MRTYQEADLQRFASAVLARHGFNSNCRQLQHNGIGHHTFISSNGIVRIPKEPHSSCFYAEKWAMDKAIEQGVPAPSSIINTKKDCVPVDYMIQELMHGKKMVVLTPGEARHMGYVLARIHGVATSGYGKLKPDGTGYFETWTQYLARRRVMLCNAAINHLVNFEEDKKISKLYDEMEAVAGFHPVLNHGDFQRNNLLFENGVLTGVLDFAPKSGSPYYDVGGLSSKLSKEEFAEFRKGYGNHLDSGLIYLHAVDRIIGALFNMSKINPGRAKVLKRKLELMLK
jgi:fructosamine-3-kinase